MGLKRQEEKAKYVCQRHGCVNCLWQTSSPFEHIGIPHQIPVEIMMKTSRRFKVGRETFDLFPPQGLLGIKKKQTHYAKTHFHWKYLENLSFVLTLSVEKKDLVGERTELCAGSLTGVHPPDLSYFNKLRFLCDLKRTYEEGTDEKVQVL